MGLYLEIQLFKIWETAAKTLSDTNFSAWVASKNVTELHSNFSVSFLVSDEIVGGIV